jgi:hypothetical protein
VDASLDAYCKDGECYIECPTMVGILVFFMHCGGGVMVLVECEFNEL